MSVQAMVYMFTASFIALFPVMNPVGNGFIINSFFGGTEGAVRRTYAKRIFTNTLLVGLGSLAIGHLVMLLFGLAVPVIQIGGGFLICKTGLDLLSDKGPAISLTTDQKKQAIEGIDPDDTARKLFYPLSFPIGIGPGSISVIFTLMATAMKKGYIVDTGINYAVIGLVIVVMSSILYAFLLQGDRITRRLGMGANLIVNKMVAFLTFCVGLQIVVNGVGNAFNIAVL